MNEYKLGDMVLYMDKSGFTVPAIVVSTHPTHPYNTLRERVRDLEDLADKNGDYYFSRLYRKGAKDLLESANAADKQLPCPSADHLYTLNVLAGPEAGIVADVPFSANFRPGCFRGLA